ncbi:MAG: hypothetical protein K1X53_03050 [Candidatus Sumerlaeaceae bacterium]|nr:hypothetical protein [Candidatus Sumerlaeaceae bacterium]
MSQCTNFQEAASLALGSGAPLPEWAVAHAGDCKACGDLWEQLSAAEATLSAAGTDGEISVPAGMHDRIMASVRQEMRMTPPMGRTPGFWQMGVGIAVAAALVLLVVSGRQPQPVATTKPTHQPAPTAQAAQPLLPRIGPAVVAVMIPETVDETGNDLSQLGKMVVSSATSAARALAPQLEDTNQSQPAGALKPQSNAGPNDGPSARLDG